MTRIDAHQHFWKYSQKEYAWISDEQINLQKDFLPKHLEREQKRVAYKGSIAVQARQTIEETEWLLSLAEENEIIKAVVGWVDLRGDDLSFQLDRFAKYPKFKGVRHVVQDEPEDHFILNPDFVAGIRKLGDYNLIYEILVYARQLKYATRLVEMFPEQSFVLDHIAKPDIRSGKIRDWETDIREIAKFSNISVKVSGLVTEADHKNWRKEDIYPYLNVVLEAFGPDRIMIGSDWPVCLLAASYAQVVCLVEGFFEELSKEAREQIFGKNAIRIYRL